jgi:hypothetical protein
MNVLIEKGASKLYDLFFNDVEEFKQFLKTEFNVIFYNRQDLEEIYFDCLANDFKNFKEECNFNGADIGSFKALTFNKFLKYVLGLGYIDNEKMFEIFENNPNVCILSTLLENGYMTTTYVDFSDKTDIEVAFYNLFGGQNYKIIIN